MTDNKLEDFIPPDLKALLNDNSSTRVDLPQGVTRDRGLYRADLKKYGRKIYLGRFHSAKVASRAYKVAKQNHVRGLAVNYFIAGAISEKTLNMIKNWKA